MHKVCRRFLPYPGFTLIEILVVIGMIGILATTVLVAVNPLHQFAQARNAQRVSNVNTILNAIGNRLAENAGLFVGDGCTVDLPHTELSMGNENMAFDIRPCLVPVYIAEMPIDPSVGVNTCSDTACSGGVYTTGYTVNRDATNRVTVCAPHSVDDGAKKPYCLSR